MGNAIVNYEITNYEDIGVKYKPIQEVADMLGTSRQTIYRYFNNNLIKKYNFKNNIYIAITDIDIIEQEYRFNKEKRNKKDITINSCNNTAINSDVTVQDCNNNSNITVTNCNNYGHVTATNCNDDVNVTIAPNYEELYSKMVQENAYQASLIYDLYKELADFKQFKLLYSTLKENYQALKKEKDSFVSLIDILTAERDTAEKELSSRIEEIKFLRRESEKSNADIKELTSKYSNLKIENKRLNEELNQLKITTSMNDEYKKLYNTLNEDYRAIQKEKDSIKDNQIQSLKEINGRLHSDIEILINTTKDTQFLLAQRQLEASKESAITIESEKESFFKKIFKKYD